MGQVGTVPEAGDTDVSQSARSHGTASLEEETDKQTGNYKNIVRAELKLSSWQSYYKPIITVFPLLVSSNSVLPIL